MKKLFLILLVVFTLAVSVSIADNAIDFYSGTWFSAIQLKGNYYWFELIHLFDDGTGFFCCYIVDDGVVDESNENMITWEITENGIHINNKNGIQNYILQDNGTISDGMKYTPAIYKKVFGHDVRQPYSGNTGIKVPSGVYIAGEDFPSGTYRIELENDKNGGVVLLYENMDISKKAFSYTYEYMMNSSSPVVGKMIIEDGNALEIRNTTVVLLPYEGLK